MGWNRDSPPAFSRSAADLGQISAKDVGEAADRGDPDAIDILKSSGRYLGRGLSVLIDIFNPERIVIGSIFARSGRHMWAEAQKVIEEETLVPLRRVCDVVPAELGDALGDFASLCVARREWVS